MDKGSISLGSFDMTTNLRSMIFNMHHVADTVVLPTSHSSSQSVITCCGDPEVMSRTVRVSFHVDGPVGDGLL